jgi:hypothetical protein
MPRPPLYLNQAAHEAPRAVTLTLACYCQQLVKRPEGIADALGRSPQCPKLIIVKHSLSWSFFTDQRFWSQPVAG